MGEPDRTRLLELVELIEGELTSALPDWPKVREAARELWERVRTA